MTTFASLLLTLGLGAGPGSAVGDVVITLPMQARVHGTEIELGEIARIDAADPELVRKLAAQSLGYAPGPGYSRLLFADRIHAQLIERVPEAAVRFVGEKACRIWPATEVVEAEAIEAAAQVELERRFAGQDASFKLSSPIPRIVIPQGKKGFELRARATTQEVRGAFVQVNVEILVDGELFRSVWTSWRAEVWRTATVLRRPVRAGETLEPNMFESRRVSGPMAAGLSPAALRGAVAARDMEAGAVVTQGAIQRPRVTKPGDAITLIVRKGPIQARVMAVALESVAVGDRLRVRTNSGLELSAVLIDREAARINLSR